MDLMPPAKHPWLLTNPRTRRRDVSTTNELVERYVGIWNESDPEKRREGIAGIWTEDAMHILEPPQQVQEIAGTLKVEATFQARGHAELEDRVGRAYEEFIADGENTFRAQGEGARIGDVVKFRWEMVTKSGDVAGVGLEFVRLAPDGRIQTDYQFIEG
jgi:hypothetical protein